MQLQIFDKSYFNTFIGYDEAVENAIVKGQRWKLVPINKRVLKASLYHGREDFKHKRFPFFTLKIVLYQDLQALKHKKSHRNHVRNEIIPSNIVTGDDNFVDTMFQYSWRPTPPLHDCGFSESCRPSTCEQSFQYCYSIPKNQSRQCCFRTIRSTLWIQAPS